MPSKLEKISDKQLIKYLNYVRRVLSTNKTDIPQSEDDLENFFYIVRYHKKIGDLLFRSILSSWDRLDLEYLFMLLIENNESSESIRRPQLQDFTIRYEEKIRVIKTNTWESNLDSYLNLSENYSYVYETQAEGDFDFFGDLIDEDTEDSDSIDGEITDIF